MLISSVSSISVIKKNGYSKIIHISFLVISLMYNIIVYIANITLQLYALYRLYQYFKVHM